MLGRPDPEAAGARGAGVLARLLRGGAGAAHRGAALRLPRGHAARPAAAVRRALLPGRGGASCRAGTTTSPAPASELAQLQWLDLAAARALPLPFITEVVLSEIEALLADPDPARPVPFFHQTAGGLALPPALSLDRRGERGRRAALDFPAPPRAGAGRRATARGLDDGEADHDQDPAELDRRHRALLRDQEELAHHDREDDRCGNTTRSRASTSSTRKARSSDLRRSPAPEPDAWRQGRAGPFSCACFRAAELSWAASCRLGRRRRAGFIPTHGYSAIDASAAAGRSCRRRSASPGCGRRRRARPRCPPCCRARRTAVSSSVDLVAEAVRAEGEAADAGGEAAEPAEVPLQHVELAVRAEVGVDHQEGAVAAQAAASCPSGRRAGGRPGTAAPRRRSARGWRRACRPRRSPAPRGRSWAAAGRSPDGSGTRARPRRRCRRSGGRGGSASKET